MIDKYALDVQCTCGEPLGYALIDDIVVVSQCPKCRRDAWQDGYDDAVETRAERYAGLDDLREG
jgi:hypothetical protein